MGDKMAHGQSCMCDYCVDRPFNNSGCSKPSTCECGFCAKCMGDIMGDAADDAYAGDPYITGDEPFGGYDEGPFFGQQARRKPLCTNADIHRIVKNLIKARKNSKPIPRETLDKHVAEIAKIRFNHDMAPRDIEQTLYELTEKAVEYGAYHSTDLYRRIALCAILLADAAERGEW